jgi:hypothetical protein
MFREIGIDDDYKLIDFTGWSVTDMYTILQGTDSLKLLRSSTSTSSFEIREMVVTTITSLKLIRQYLIDIYQFQTVLEI